MAALNYRRLVLALVGGLSLIGALAWFGMDRQEDPFFPYRFGQVLVTYPGALPEQIERLVLNPLEEELAQVEEIDEIDGSARLGVAVVTVRMHDHVYDTDTAWERIRIAAQRAAQRFPDGAGTPEVEDRLDTHGIVLAITGSEDLLELREAAERLRRQLFRFKDIARIELLADPGQQVTVHWDDALVERTGLDADALGEQLAARNLTLAGGSLSSNGRSVLLDPVTEFDSLEALVATPIRTANGDAVPLGELADVRLSSQEPGGERIWFDGRPAVALGIVIPDNRVNAVRFGGQLRELVEELRPAYAPLEIHEMFFQPYWVERRLAELGVSLLLGVAILAGILFLVMGLRLGLSVALSVPLVTLSTLAIYAMGGGVLHQIAVAGMVIAVAILVDNAIVMVENVQWHLNRGLQVREAATRSVRELAAPLLTATGTTLAAFVPLLMSRGDAADFTRAIPVMVMLALVVSYLYAMLVTPVIAAAILKPRDETRRRIDLQALGRRLGTLAVHRSTGVMLATGVMMLAAVAMLPLLDHDFFPDTDREQFIVDLHFPEGTHIEHTAFQVDALSEDLGALSGVHRVDRFVGFSGPRFYYNLLDQPQQPHLARLVVHVDDIDDIAPLMSWVRRMAVETLPDAEVVARRLGQGPPVSAPIEIRVFGDENDALAEAVGRVLEVVRSAEGTRDARHQLGEGLAALRISVDDARAAALGLSRRDVAMAVARASRGVEVSTWRAERDPAPLLIRSPEGERFPSTGLEGLSLTSSEGGAVPLGEVATLQTVWQPAVIYHRDLQRMSTVLAEVAEGYTYAGALEGIVPRLAELRLPEGVYLEIGGMAQSAGEANSALFQTLPLGLLLLVIFLLAQFNSFRQMGIVLATVPLAMIGVVPGLWLTGQPFGFTALLGVIALAGVVINNAIVLLDVTNAGRAGGASLDEALVAAVARRTRPILLTAATTVAGLLPLTFTRSTLWPPMAWAIISGLSVSTLLSLVVVPALYRLLIGGRRGRAGITSHE